MADGLVTERPWTTRLPDRLRRPPGLVDETRWLFFLCNIVAWLMVVPGLFTNLNPTTMTLIVLSCTGLLGSWTYMYLTKGSPVWLDLAYSVSVAGYALCCPVPAMAYAFGFTAIWYRSLYGSNLRIALYAVGTVLAMTTAVLLWGVIPGHDPSTPAINVLGTAPVILLVVAASRYLSLSLIAREESQRRDGTLAQLGSQLLAIMDREQIYRCARESVAAICATTAGLRAFVGIWDAETGEIRVRDKAGPFSDLPADWPFGVMPPAEPVGTGPVPLPDSAELAELAGFHGPWLALPLPDEPDGWMLIGSPTKISDDVIVAFNSLINQVALALRNSEAHHDLDLQANTDSLTGLLNRAAFTVAVERAFVARPGRLALMFLDLDDFKIVNDSLGHAAGDELLSHVATRMREAIRGDDQCARLGGDEFAVLLHDSGDGPAQSAAAAIAQRLIDLISEPVGLGGRIVQIGASVGVAHASPDITPELLLQRADVAMYAAKAQGKNRFQVFEPGLLQPEEQDHSLAALDLRLER